MRRLGLERERVVAVKDDERGAIDLLTGRVVGLVKDAGATPDAALVALALAAREILDRLETTQDTARRQRG